MQFIYTNGRFLIGPEATISVEERGFRFADGVFEAIRVENAVPYQWQWHMRRLAQGLQALYIPYDVEALAPACRELLKRNQPQEGVLRIYVSRGRGSRGYLPALAEYETPCVVIETLPLPAPQESPVKIFASNYEKISPRALPAHIKHAQGLNPALARMEAVREHCFEALQLNASGHICEGSSSNIFWVKDGRLHTPALTCGVLNGSTRAALLRVSPYEVVEGQYALDALQNAQAVMLTNISWEVLAVECLQPQGWSWKSEPIAEILRDALRKDRKAYCAQRQVGWNEESS